MNNISKILAILSLPLLLNACGGGGGGAGGAASYTLYFQLVPSILH